LLDELRVAADRARDERLKLARLVKHSADLPINSSSSSAAGYASAPADGRIVDLSAQVQRLEQAVSEKLEALGQAQQDIDSRTQYLESLRHTITDTTRAFVTQVEQAQHFKAHVDAAKQHVRMSAGRVVEDIRQHLAELESPIADRIKTLNDLDDQIDKRIARMQQMHKQAGDAVDQHLLGALRAAKEQAADMTAPMKAEIDKYLAGQRERMEQAIHTKIAELDVDVEEALRPLTERFDAIIDDAKARAGQVEENLAPLNQRFEQIVEDAQAHADLLAETMPDRIETLVTEQLDKMRDTFAEKAKVIVDGLDKGAMDQAGQIIHERIARELDNYLAQCEEEAGGYVDGLVGKLDEARAQAVDRFRQELGEIESDASIDRDQMLVRLEGELERVQELAQERVAKAQQAVEQAADGIHARAAAAVETALQNADLKLDEYESSAVQHLRAIDDGIEHGIEDSRKRLTEYEKEAIKQGDEALRLTDAGIAEAQNRLSGFENSITQRVGLTSQSVDDAIDSLDEKLGRVERDASARVMNIVELAETSGKAVADSISALAESAQRTAAKAQADLDAKLDAFEEISAEALKTAEQTLRANIGDLRDSSRAMIEMVSRQVKAQANEIEPQTREVITQAEQTMRRRIGELRDAAQSMVEITVSRLESQLNQVKTKAQQTAFKGIEPGSEQPGGDSPQAHDAA